MKERDTSASGLGIMRREAFMCPLHRHGDVRRATMIVAVLGWVCDFHGNRWLNKLTCPPSSRVLTRSTRGDPCVDY